MAGDAHGWACLGLCALARDCACCCQLGMVVLHMASHVWPCVCLMVLARSFLIFLAWLAWSGGVAHGLTCLDCPIRIFIYIYYNVLHIYI